MSLKKGYLGDPREESIVWHSGVCKTGVLLEADNRMEARYSWNGMIIDLCDMPPTGDNSYSQTIFHISGSVTNGGSDDGGQTTGSTPTTASTSSKKVISKVSINGDASANTVTIELVDESGNTVYADTDISYEVTFYSPDSASEITAKEVITLPQGGNRTTLTAPAPRGVPRAVSFLDDDELDEQTVDDDGTQITINTSGGTIVSTISFELGYFYYGQYPYMSGATLETVLDDNNRTSCGEISNGQVVTMTFKVRGGTKEDIMSSATDEELEVKYANDFFIMVPDTFYGTFTIDNGLSDETNSFVLSDLAVSGYKVYISSDITDQLNIFVGDGTENSEMEYRITFTQNS